MDILIYNELNPVEIKGFDKLVEQLKQDDFKSADVKKIQNNLYRAKLNRSDRMLFSIYQYQNKKYILLLEYLKSHDYQGARFLNGDAVIQEQEIPTIENLDILDADQQMVYINPNHPQFVYLNKFISFDDVQQAIYQHALPLVIIGSAGSGKTAILLEKIKKLEGKVLYVTLSNFLVKNSRELYFSDDYYNEHQQLDFYSFDEFVESIDVPETKIADFQVFATWYKTAAQRKFNVHSLYEEFRGVLTGADTTKAYLSESDYLNLGIKQSIFDRDERADVYAIFNQYRHYLNTENYHDTNILSYDYLEKNPRIYDYVVVDEVQDITAIQLYLILRSLKTSGSFMICGDANQIVHPNFFSWAKVKTLFHHHEQLHQGQDITHILHHNYRNSKRVTEISNRVLLLKNARFGSIDKESHYLVDTNTDLAGGVFFLKNNPNILSELDKKTAISTQFAVVVMHEEQKKLAQRIFKTPLVFSIQEAKGLEYKNIILYNFVSVAHQHFDEICSDISIADLQKDFEYARNKDKADKSLEIYKFYINALYVGMTRAMYNLYWIEKSVDHPIFSLLGLQNAVEHLDLEEQQSSLQDWQREAKKLELQGKTEQAQRIRQEILKEEKPLWTVLDQAELKRLEVRALSAEKEDKKARLSLFEYAIVHHHWRYLFDLSEQGFKPAKAVLERPSQYQKAKAAIEAKYYLPYGVKNPTVLMQNIEKFGINFRNEFNQTPLMAATWRGNIDLFLKLLQDGAAIDVYDNEYRQLLHIALLQASHSEKYSKQFLKLFYDAYPQESLILQIDRKLFKIQPHQAEYILFHSLFAAFMDKFHELWVQRRCALNSTVLMEIVEHFPDSILPAYRKQRRYLSNFLSQNELSSQAPYNKKLFVRVERGEYIFNPKLLIKMNNEWHKIYQILDIRRINYFTHADVNLSEQVGEGYNQAMQTYLDSLFTIVDFENR